MSRSRPNILFIMSDDHASHAISAYGSRINQTPHIDRIAEEGMRFDNCFCTNSICTPSRAAILTGTYNHVNGVTTLSTHLDGRLLNYPKVLQQHEVPDGGGGQVAPGARRHPRSHGFRLLERPARPGPVPRSRDDRDGSAVDAKRVHHRPDYGLMRLEWLRGRDRERPFCLMVHHKAPHRPWEPDDKHASMYEDEDIPEPETFDDDYSNRAQAAAAARMRVERDLNAEDLKVPVPEGLSPAEKKSWKYQRYIKDYLRCVASIDDNVGRLLDFIDEEDIGEETIVIYTSDQGFFLGDHGWYDKRFMYEESLRMPFLIRYPREVAAGSVNGDMILNVDFPATFLDCAGVDIPPSFQGRSFRSLLHGETPADWQTSMYYRYWMHGAHHNVCAHYGVRTLRYKLIYYYGDPLGQEGAVGPKSQPEWELFDLEKDPCELNSVYADPDYADVVIELKAELARLQEKVGDVAYDAQ